MSGYIPYDDRFRPQTGWRRTQWWDWHRWIGKTWRGRGEVYDPYEYQTDEQRARQALEEIYGEEENIQRGASYILYGGIYNSPKGPIVVRAGDILEIGIDGCPTRQARAI